jgi:hypothetical protein
MTLLSGFTPECIVGIINFTAITSFRALDGSTRREQKPHSTVITTGFHIIWINVLFDPAVDRNYIQIVTVSWAITGQRNDWPVIAW